MKKMHITSLPKLTVLMLMLMVDCFIGGRVWVFAILAEAAE